MAIHLRPEGEGDVFSPDSVQIVAVSVLRDKQRRDAKGRPRSRGVAFVEFSEHIHALACLRVMNNNPKFAKLSNNGNERLIVGFAVENKSKLHKQQMLREEQRVKNEQKAETERIIRERQELLKMMEGGDDSAAVSTEVKAVEKKEVLTKKGRASKRKKLSSTVKSLTNVGKVANAVIATAASVSSNDKMVVEETSSNKKKKKKKRKKRVDEDDLTVAQLEEVDAQKGKKKRRRKKNKSVKMDKDDIAFDGMVAKYKKTVFKKNGGDDRWFV